jgi:hypothetical protein
VGAFIIHFASMYLWEVNIQKNVQAKNVAQKLFERMVQ